MNIVFWDGACQRDTSVHMIAVAAMLRLLGVSVEIGMGNLVPADNEILRIWEYKKEISEKDRKFLQKNDLIVACLQQKKACVDAFFEENYFPAGNRMILLGGYEQEEGMDKAYLERMYRVVPEEIAVIPYNNNFWQAWKRRRCLAFLKKELKSPTSGAEEAFVRSVRLAAVRILHKLDNMSSINYI